MKLSTEKRKTGTRYRLNYLVLLGALCFSLLGLQTLSLLAATLSLIIITDTSEKNNLFHMAWLPAIYIFLLMPIVLFLVVGHSFNEIIFIIVLAYTNFAFMTTRGYAYRTVIRPGNKFKYIYTVALLGIVAISFSGFPAAYSYLIPLLTILYALALQQASRKEGVALYILFLITILLYAAFLWGGFGRLVLAGWLILPTIVFIIRYDFWFNKYLYCLGITIVGLLMTFLRFSDAKFDELIKSATSDSSVGPYLLAQEIYENSLKNTFHMNAQGILDQLLMFLVGAFPRELWSSKPNGFGFQYTLDNLPDSFADAGHSIASLFIGEHFYYMGVWGFATCLFAVWVMTLIFKISHGFDRATGIYALPMAIWILTYVWGGIASFAQRFQMGFFIVACVLFLAYLFKLPSRPFRRQQSPSHPPLKK